MLSDLQLQNIGARKSQGVTVKLTTIMKFCRSGFHYQIQVQKYSHSAYVCIYLFVAYLTTLSVAQAIRLLII
jgi:hypothetical protein